MRCKTIHLLTATATLTLLLAAPAIAQSIALISDINGRYGSTQYHDRVGDAVSGITAIRPQLVISTGDMVAGQKQPKLDSQHLDRMWQAFQSEVTLPLTAAGIPLLPTAGNHDGSGLPGFALERERFNAHWQDYRHSLELLPGSQWPRRYAARLDGVLLVTFDGTRPGLLPAGEKEFLTGILQQYAATAEAVIVFSHLPMWPLASGREHEVLADASLLELLHHHGVDVYASGHHHVYYAATDSAGMLHLGVGALGGNARAFSGQSQRQPHSFALLEVTDGFIQVSALPAPSFTVSLPIDDLPQTIEGPLGTLRRVDGGVPIRH